MQPSTELENLILQLYKKEASGGLCKFARHLYSRQKDMLFIGSDPNEWLEDFDSVIHFYEEASAAVLGIQVDNLKAYSEGTVGWVADRVTAKLPDGVEVPVRHTYIFHKENGAWKMVHLHASIGVPNEKIGE
jgi:adenylate cyclase